MNRIYRRAIARTKRRTVAPHKKIPAQRCALWIPAACGYVAEFSPTGGFLTVEYAELAQHFDENAAARTALVFRQVTGLRVAVRPVYLH
ncbi:MAG: hypothetical protein JWO88_3626 [Frankiales bacterium]|nr:hypothetical protein [Frankiales bacterium]